MERLNTVFEDEVRKRVAIEAKKIKEEYKELLKKVKEEFKQQLSESKEGLSRQKSECHSELRAAKDEYKKGVKKNKEEYNLEIRKYQDDYREKIKKCHVDYSIYLKQVSENYGIPYRLLIRDAPNEDDIMCKGIRPNGTRCNVRAKKNGYCNFHQSQVSRSSIVEMVNDPTSSLPERKGLIDFSTMM
jgi:gas vesicle protein